MQNIRNSGIDIIEKLEKRRIGVILSIIFMFNLEKMSQRLKYFCFNNVVMMSTKGYDYQTNENFHFLLKYFLI